MNNVKPQLHQSQLSMLAKCGEQYRRRYVEGDIVPPGVALLIGSATHRSVERNLRHKAETKGQLLSLDEIGDTVRDDFKSRWDNEGVTLDEIEAVKGTKAVMGEAIDLAIDLAQVHATDLAPIINPISPKHIERKFVVELPGFPFDLAGTIDIQEPDCIRDTKTSGKTLTQSDADGSEQLTFYAIGAHVLDSIDLPMKVVLDGLIKTKTRKAVTVESVRSQDQVQRLLRRIERAAEIVDRGMFMPADPTSWVCSTKWCGYAHTCPFWSGRP